MVYTGIKDHNVATICVASFLMPMVLLISGVIAYFIGEEINKEREDK